MVKLKVLANYFNGQERYQKGQTIEVEEEKARWLQSDSPGCFRVVKPRARRKRVSKPPVDKAVQEAPEEK